MQSRGAPRPEDQGRRAAAFARRANRPPEARLRLWTLLSLAVIVPVGFCLKLYTGPGQALLNNSLAGLAYEIFWCLVLFFIWPRRGAVSRIVVGVFLVTCGLEALQLWHPAFLEAIRSTFPGKAIIGTTFTWSDFAYYVVGSTAGWLWLAWMCRRAGSPRQPPQTSLPYDS
ncbi:MAG: ribosomal maturation YjgA family protein [Planctomycetota bacterium]|jgi:hypothetical protein